MLQSDFVCGWKNIKGEEYAGMSFGYSKHKSAVGTTNGAGPHNVQLFVLSPDEVVMHALPGFWHPEDLTRELRLAKVLYRLWKDDTRTDSQKKQMFRRMQLAAVRRHPKVTYARSSWQGFDGVQEVSRLRRREQRDTFLLTYDGKPKRDARGNPQLKPINQLVHERMARRPFVAFADFDITGFVDYGQLFYDNNMRVEKQGVRISSWWNKKRKKKKRS